MFYYLFAGSAAYLVAKLGEMHILDVLGFKSTNEQFDMFMTMLILTAGADRVAALIKLSGPGAADPPEARPLEVTGTLTLEDRNAAVRAS